MLLSIAIRNLLRQRTRAILTFASVCLGVVSLLLAAGFIDDLLRQLREATIHSQLGHFEVFAPGYIDGARRDPLAHTLARPAEAIAALRKVSGVATVAPRLQFPGLASNGRADVAVSIEGIDPVAEAQIGTALAIVGGHPLESASSSAIVGEGLARTLDVHVGDTLTLLVSTKDGALNTLDVPLAGVFRSPFRDYDERTVRMRLDDAKALAAVDSVNALAVLLAPGTSVENTLAALRQALPSARYDVRAWWQLADFYEATAALYRRQFLVLLVIVALMVSLGVANSINMALHERQGEFGTIRALGYGAVAVFRQIVVESAVLGVAAAAVGLALGAVAAAVISAVGIPMPPPPNSDRGYTAAIELSAISIATAFGVGFLASVAGSLLPARRLARMPIVDALRQAI